jgi:hypothetical protein
MIISIDTLSTWSIFFGREHPQQAYISRAFFSMQHKKKLHVDSVSIDIETYCIYHPLIDIVLRFNIW